MKLIEKKQLAKIVIETVFDDVSDDILAHPSVNENLKNYQILTLYPEKFREIDSLNLYYNRYCWYLKFLVSYQKAIGFDAGLEQQEFKILEEGENFMGIDWSEIERISNEIKK